jgi:hypothetical protein
MPLITPSILGFRYKNYSMKVQFIFLYVYQKKKKNAVILVHQVSFDKTLFS